MKTGALSCLGHSDERFSFEKGAKACSFIGSKACLGVGMFEVAVVIKPSLD